MILDRLDKWKLYFPEDSLIARGFSWLQHSYDPTITEGRIDIDGDRLFALPQGYQTKPHEQARFEGHRRYLDIQFVLRGAEIMGWSSTDGLKVDEEYDDAKDLIWYEKPRLYTPLHVKSGEFALFYPTDAHAPGLKALGHDDVFKVVLKVYLGTKN